MSNPVDAVILCGGAGSRLKSITGDSPKPMAQIADRPFLDLLLLQLEKYDFRHVILAVGYGSEVIESHFGAKSHGLELAYSVETTSLGTGGALRNSLNKIATSTVLVMNGDSFTDADLRNFEKMHFDGQSDVTVMVVPGDEREDCGWVTLNEHGRVEGFDEKTAVPSGRYVNAGIYLISRSLVSEITPDVEVSLEKQLFPEWLRCGKHVSSFLYEGKCFDIGTPARYDAAKSVLAASGAK